MTQRIRNFLNKQFPFLSASPAVLLEVYFLYATLLVLLIYSLLQLPPTGKLPTFTLQHYRELFTGVYLHTIVNSFLLAGTTAALCLFVGFPIAYYIAVKAKRLKMVLLVFLILPSWTSFIVQVYAWFFLLEKRGIVSRLLQYLGIIGETESLLNTYASTLLGMVYCYLPFMVFPLFAVMERMDKRLLEASADLGANRWQTLKRVIIPMACSGIVAGLFLVFIPAFGEFVIPELLGGARSLYVGTIIVDKLLVYNNWQSAAATVFLMLIFPLICILFVLAGLYVLMRQRNRTKKSNVVIEDVMATQEVTNG